MTPLTLDAGLGFLTLWPLLAFLAVALALPWVRRHAKLFGFVDTPGGRKLHENSVPPVGGLVIIPFALLISYAAGLSPGQTWPFATGLLLLLGAGSWDDGRGLSPWIKLSVQIAAALLLVFFHDLRIENLGNLFGMGPIHFGRWAYPFTIFCIVLLINALNMIDGLDGLAGGIAFIALFWFALACIAYDGPSLPAGFIGIWMGAIAGFLIYNLRNPWRRKASVFLGDAGSMALGFTLAWLAIGLSQSGHPEPMIKPIAVAWILTVPVMDAFALFVNRALQKRHPFEADRRHLHHRFVDAGIPAAKVTPALLLLSLACGAFGYGASRAGVPDGILTLIWIALVLANAVICRFHQSFVDAIKARRSGSSS